MSLNIKSERKNVHKFIAVLDDAINELRNILHSGWDYLARILICISSIWSEY